MKTGEACDRPRRPFGPLLIDWYRGEALEGRGGSVSRRDLNQLARKRAQLAWGLKLQRKRQLYIPATLREGVRGRRFS